MNSTFRKTALAFAAAICAFPALAVVNDIDLKNVTPRAGELDIELRSLEQITISFTADVNVRPNTLAYLATPDGQELTAPIVRNQYLANTVTLTFPDINYYNGDYTLTIKKWSVGDEEWIADFEQGHSNPEIKIVWTVTAGLQEGVEYDIMPVSVLPANNSVFTYPASPLTVIQITMPGGTILSPDFSAHLSNVEARYQNELTFIAEDKGNNVVYTAAVCPSPSVDGDYTLTFPAGMFGDEEYITEGKGHANPALTYLYTTNPSDPDSTGDDEIVDYSLKPSNVKLVAENGDYSITWRWSSGTQVKADMLKDWCVLDSRGYKVADVAFSLMDSEEPTAGTVFKAALQPEDRYTLLIPGGMYHDGLFESTSGLQGTANPQLRYDFIPKDITAGITAPEAAGIPTKRTVYTAQGICLHDDATDAQIRALTAVLAASTDKNNALARVLTTTSSIASALAKLL